MQIPPSYSTSADQCAAGLELAPFQGVRYVPDRVSGLADVTSPPYDVIVSDNEDQLMAADPHNVVRLILPRPVPGRPGEEYSDAAELLRRWLTERILVADPVPALYVYEQATAEAVIQRGLIGRLRLVEPEARIVLPHEDVSPGPVAGRLQLMEATQANLEPIFLLYDGAVQGEPPLLSSAADLRPLPCGLPAGLPGAASRIVGEVAGSDPLVETLTPDGLRHRLWAITDPGDLAVIAADLAPRQALIADGHHRYAAYLRLRDRRHEAGDGPGPGTTAWRCSSTQAATRPASERFTG